MLLSDSVIVIVEKLLPFKSLYFACKRKLSKTSRQVEILPVSVTRDRSRQTSGHPAHAIGAVASSSQTKET